MDTITIDRHDSVSAAVVRILAGLEQRVFDSPISQQTLTEELGARKDVLVLIALCSGKPAGYKVGFRHSSKIFYSWIGGVDPGFRRRGIARMLMDEQHRILRELGYSIVRTQTKNKFREMLLLNIACGFDITGVQKKIGESDQSIVLEKALF